MNFDDPRITAHALGELDNPEDVAAVERLLQDSPEARAEFEEIKSFTSSLSRELKGEQDAALTERQRSVVLAAVKDETGLNGKVIHLAEAASKRKSPWYRQTWMPVGIAAVALFATVIVAMWDHSQFEEKHVRVLAQVNSPEVKESAAPALSRGRENSEAPLGSARYEEAQQGLRELQEAPAAPTSEALVKEESGSKVSTVGTSNDAAPSGRVRVISSQPEGDTKELALGVIPSEPMRQKLAPSPSAPPPPSPSPAFGDRSDITKDAAPADAPTELFGNEALPQIVTGPAPASAAPAAPKSVGRSVADQVSSELKLELAPGQTAAQGGRGGSARNEDFFSANAPEATRGTVSRSRAANPSATAAGALPGKPASLSARGGATGLSDSENEFLGRDYSMRNFRQEAEEGRGYALVIPAPVPGLPPPIAPDLDSYYKRLAPPAPAPEHNTEAYDAIQDNRFLSVKDNPLSTFSIDVDTASYANVRRFLTGGALPPKGAVRIEELVNYFTYDYPQPQGADPFSSTLEVATCPWEPKHRLVRIGLKGRDLPKEQRPPSNLVFLIDVSGSMQPQNKLPLVKESLQQMIGELGPKDTVAIAVYAGASGTVLEPTSDRDAIRAALARLEAGGSTNGASGIQLAYDLARRSYNKEGNNRVVLATDGDFNVGVTNRSELVELIEKRAKEGVFLTVLGFGMGNLKDATLEQLADKGNGNYAYIDSIREGRKVLVEEMAGTLFTIAKDVKTQVEFNPAQVSAYRLIGYENRLLAKEDFNDDKKDAGEIGAGHTVTALYQVVPAGVAIESPGVDPLKYQPKPDAAPTHAAPAEGASKEMLTLKLRFKQPDGDTSTLREFPLIDEGLTWERSSRDFRFASAVASFGMLLRDSPHKGSSNWDSTMELAVEGKGEDAGGYRQEFIGLVEKAKSLPAPASAK